MSGDRNSGCRSSAVISGSYGGRSSSGGRGGSGNRVTKKKGGWEDCGVEFYREAYPGAVENIYDTTHLRTLLPSKRYSVGTLGRTSSRRRLSTRNRVHGAAGSAATTRVHTTRRGSDTYLEVLPDLTQGVDEEETWSQMQTIRHHAISMAEKRKMKRQLMAAPMLRTRGLKKVHLSRKKFTSQFKTKLHEIISKIGLWHGSLRYVEGNFGTGLVAFFTFIKWLLYLNLFTSILIAIFIIVPQVLFTKPEDWCRDGSNTSSTISLLSSSFSPENIDTVLPISSQVPLSSTKVPPTEAQTPFTIGHSTATPLLKKKLPVLLSSPSAASLFIEYEDPDDDGLCCYEEYKEDAAKRDEYSPFIQWVLDLLQGTGKLEISHLFYGFYPRVSYSFVELNKWHYSLPLAYLSVMVVIMILSLMLMVRKAARGLKESLRSSEGQFYQFSNLVFGGWDHCIENSKAATIKKKAIFNEIRNHLETEQYKEEKALRTRKYKCRLYFFRLIVNILVIGILGGAFFAIYKATDFAFQELLTHQGIQFLFKGHSLSPETKLFDTNFKNVEPSGEPLPWWLSLLLEYLPVITIISLNIVIPFIFKMLVRLEHYTPNFILRLTLIRTMFLRLASLVILLFTVYQRIRACKQNETNQCRSSLEHCSEQMLCWETYVGQQLYKLAILDLLLMIVNTFFINFPRKMIGHRLLKGSKMGEFIGSIEFEIPKHVLDIVYGQTLCWLGMFYSPLLPAITCVKLVFVFYIKYFDCSINTTQSSQLYRTSRSNSLFISILLISFIVTIIPVGYSIAEIKPSVSCGPFYTLPTIWSEVVNVIEDSPQWLKSFLFFLGTAGFAVPSIILLMLAWYYYYAVAGANKHMVSLLKHQLVLEGHDKQFLLTRLDRLIERTKELEELQRSEVSSELNGEFMGGNDLTLDIRAG